ncbi:MULTISPECIES: hypothetical protein [unclassified Moorena]|nr:MULTISPECIES: hypothetical protein [unclassified Moorena]
MHNYQVHRIVFLLPTSHFRLPISAAPCSEVPAPCSLKTHNEST